MSDIYGIGSGIKDGDRVVFSSREHAKHTERLCKLRGIKINYVISDPTRPPELYKFEKPRGRTIFDHSWVEQYFMHSIEQAEKHLKFWAYPYGNKEASVHTEMAEREFTKWRCNFNY